MPYKNKEDNVKWYQDNKERIKKINIQRKLENKILKEEGLKVKEWVDKKKSDNYEYNHDYYIKNRETILEKSRKYQKENKQKLKKTRKEYYENNKHIFRYHSKMFELTNPEKSKQIKKKWRDNNKDYFNNYYENNKERMLEQKLRYYNNKKKRIQDLIKKFRYNYYKINCYTSIYNRNEIYKYASIYVKRFFNYYKIMDMDILLENYSEFLLHYLGKKESETLIYTYPDLFKRIYDKDLK